MMAKAPPVTLGIRVVLLLALVGACGYVFWQRGQVNVAVENLVLIDRVAGGFLGIGTGGSKPGIVILSAVPRKRVDVRVETGGAFRQPALRIERDGQVERHALTQACAVLIEDGRPTRLVAVDWPAAIFRDLKDAIDRDDNLTSSKEHPLSGRPFVEMTDVLGERESGGIPAEIAEFVERVEE